MTVPAIIYHLAQRADWASAQAAGQYRAPSLDAEGFIHASADEAQLLRVAARLFPGHADLLALDVAVAQLDTGSPVLPEPARSGEIYPHIYGPINADAITRVRALVPNAAAPGAFTLVDLDAGTMLSDLDTDTMPDASATPDANRNAGAA